MVLDFRLVIRLFIQFGRIGCWFLNMRAGKVRMISLVSGYSFLFKTRHWRKDSIGFQLIIEYLVILEEAFQFDLGCLR